MFRTDVWLKVQRISGALFDWLGGEYATGGQRFGVPGELTTRCFRGRFPLGLYELPERLLLWRYLRRGATVLELGGCLGVVSCLVNTRLRDPRRHVVVEANPALLPWLEANRARNRARFEIEDGVIGRREGERAFWAGEAIVSGSASFRHAGTQPVPVRGRRLEELEARHGLSFDTLLLDIEGGEAEFLRDHPALLARARLVVVEFHPMFIGEAACAEGRAALATAGLVRRARIGLAEAWTRRRTLPARRESAKPPWPLAHASSQGLP
ncbi:FkbM family methyltransferase [Roseococcus sp. SYP-B2431]|uniref:FkbM family methyltransferase n=1 Tax=Roseococcus sp. SYP-B2431 TaxID=2496640 RepID=UPI0013F433F9|nr:FkbM family methyltransferase [Roseococcus sp. SYP-B2431]